MNKNEGGGGDGSGGHMKTWQNLSVAENFERTMERMALLLLLFGVVQIAIAIYYVNIDCLSELK